jgi:two-component system copper resistance phosphate regulon response regulator CusR
LDLLIYIRILNGLLMQENKILIIEDEPKVAGFIKQGLEENNFKAEIVQDGLKGLESALNNKYDLIILDLNLPTLNGQKICLELREKNIATPIIMLTALSSIEDKVLGFQNGANDYIIKPFEFRELIARIKVHLSHKKTNSETEQGKILKVADLEMNLETKTVKRGATIIDLTAKEISLLELFMRNEGKVFSRKEIAEKIWEIKFDSGTNVIDVYINFLRKKIDKNFERKLIHTYIGLGYVLRNETK